jgi:hypothetical protein
MSGGSLEGAKEELRKATRHLEGMRKEMVEVRAKNCLTDGRVEWLDREERCGNEMNKCQHILQN